MKVRSKNNSGKVQRKPSVLSNGNYSLKTGVIDAIYRVFDVFLLVFVILIFTTSQHRHIIINRHKTA